MKKYIVWNNTHKVLATIMEFSTVESAEKYVNILRNNIRTIMKLNAGRSKFMNADKIEFLIIDKEDFKKFNK